MASLLENLVSSISVKTAYGPDINIAKPFEPGPPSALLQALKPQIEIGIKGAAPIVIAPYGRPPPTRWPLVAVMLTVGAGVSVGFLALGILSLVSPRKSKRLTTA